MHNSVYLVNIWHVVPIVTVLLGGRVRTCQTVFRAVRAIRDDFHVPTPLGRWEDLDML